MRICDKRGIGMLGASLIVVLVAIAGAIGYLDVTGGLCKLEGNCGGGGASSGGINPCPSPNQCQLQASTDFVEYEEYGNGGQSPGFTSFSASLVAWNFTSSTYVAPYTTVASWIGVLTNFSGDAVQWGGEFIQVGYLETKSAGLQGVENTYCPGSNDVCPHAFWADAGQTGTGFAPVDLGAVTPGSVHTFSLTFSSQGWAVGMDGVTRTVVPWYKAADHIEIDLETQCQEPCRGATVQAPIAVVNGASVAFSDGSYTYPTVPLFPASSAVASQFATTDGSSDSNVNGALPSCSPVQLEFGDGLPGPAPWRC